MGNLYEGQEVIIGIGEESTFKTRLVDAGTFTVIKTDPVEVDQDVKVYEVPGSSGTKSPLFDHTFTNTSGSTPRMTLAGPLSVYEIDLLAAVTFQSVTEAAAGTKTKIFTPFSGTQPDFESATLGTVAAGAYAITAIKAFPIANTSWAMTSCIGESLKISAERDSYAKFECGLVSLEPVERDSDAHADATWERGLIAPGGTDGRSTDYGMKFFHDVSAATLEYNGGGAVAAALQSFSVEYTQEVTGEEPDGSGAFDNYGIINRGGTGEIVLLKDSVVESGLTNWEENGYIQFVVRWGAAGAAVNLELQLTVNGKITDISFDESGIIGATIGFNIAASSTTTDMLELILSNTITRTWPAPA